MSKLSFLSIFFLEPGLTKTFYLMIDFQYPLDGAAPFMLQNFKTINQSQFRSKLSFLNIFFLKPGLTKTFYLVIDFENSLDGAMT